MDRYKPTQAEIRREREADLFARCILMPEKMIKKAFIEIVKEGNTLQKIIDNLAKKFEVETVHVTLRLNELKLI